MVSSLLWDHGFRSVPVDDNDEKLDAREARMGLKSIVGGCVVMAGRVICMIPYTCRVLKYKSCLQYREQSNISTV